MTLHDMQRGILVVAFASLTVLCAFAPVEARPGAAPAALTHARRPPLDVRLAAAAPVDVAGFVPLTLTVTATGGPVDLMATAFALDGSEVSGGPWPLAGQVDRLHPFVLALAWRPAGPASVVYAKVEFSGPGRAGAVVGRLAAAPEAGAGPGVGAGVGVAAATAATRTSMHAPRVRLGTPVFTRSGRQIMPMFVEPAPGPAGPTR